ncbi:hypothetical protein KJ966_03650 [bacterium]|nr:hypothetical protein [bacterium]
MPIRESWLKTYPPGQKPRKGGRIYDGKSKGLCPAAREILLNRFSICNTLYREKQ